MTTKKRTLNRDTYKKTFDSATDGGRKSATFAAEEKMHRGESLDPLADPKGPPHLGPIRRSLPRFEKQGNLWVLTNGIPMPEETLLDTTGSMGNNVDLALKSLILAYEMYTNSKDGVLRRYDPQIATATFNDVYDNIYESKPVLCRTQFEMDEKIAVQMALCPPGRNGHGNGKEDPQFGLFGAAYLTKAAINGYGLKYYHFTATDEPVVPVIDLKWLKTIFGDDVLEQVKANGWNFKPKEIPDTAKTIADLQSKSHAFILQVGNRSDVKAQWKELYGGDHFVMLPDGTEYLHCVKAVIIGLTEGVLDLRSAQDFLLGHKVGKNEANQIIRAVAHIPLGAQTLCPNFHKIPKAGDFFREKTDLWPVDPDDMETMYSDEEKETTGDTNWL